MTTMTNSATQVVDVARFNADQFADISITKALPTAIK
jgi:hypothetical protein